MKNPITQALDALREYSVWKALLLIPGVQIDGKARRRERRAQERKNKML